MSSGERFALNCDADANEADVLTHHPVKQPVCQSVLDLTGKIRLAKQ